MSVSGKAHYVVMSTTTDAHFVLFSTRSFVWQHAIIAYPATAAPTNRHPAVAASLTNVASAYVSAIFLHSGREFGFYGWSVQASISRPSTAGSDDERGTHRQI